MHYIQNLIKQGLEGRMVNLTLLMGEGFILLIRGYRFMGGGVTLKVVRLAFLFSTKDHETVTLIVRRRETSITS